jgi:hypothetical protein
MSTFRVGTKVAINVYDGDAPVCQCHTREQAAEIVAAVNFYRTARREVAERCWLMVKELRTAEAAEAIKREFNL